MPYCYCIENRKKEIQASIISECTDRFVNMETGELLDLPTAEVQQIVVLH